MSIEYVVFLGIFLTFVGTYFYIVRTLRGQNKPNRMSYLMWSIVPLISVAASLAQGVTWPVVPVLAAALCPFAIFLASFVNPNAYWKLSRFDYACGAISILALFLWWLTDEPNLAILLAIVADGFAGYPTLIKCWRHPDTESSTEYAAAAFNAVLAFVVAESWSFAAIAFPAYIIVINTMFVAGILRGRVRARVI